MANAVTASVAIGVALLAVALLFTPVMNTTTSDTTTYVEVDNSSVEQITDRLDLKAVEINETNSTVTLENTNDFNSSTKTINESVETKFNVSGATLLVSNTEIVTNNTTAQYRVTYPPTFAWNNYAATFMTNLDLLIAVLGLLLIMWPLVAIL